MLFLRDAFENGYVSGTLEQKGLITELASLTQTTLCSEANEHRFDSLIKYYHNYKNVVALVKKQQEEYKKSCVEYNEKDMPWNASV